MLQRQWSIQATFISVIRSGAISSSVFPESTDSIWSLAGRLRFHPAAIPPPNYFRVGGNRTIVRQFTSMSVPRGLSRNLGYFEGNALSVMASGVSVSANSRLKALSHRRR